MKARLAGISRVLALAMIFICCALLWACAGQKLEIRPHGQAVFGASTGSR